MCTFAYLEAEPAEAESVLFAYINLLIYWNIELLDNWIIFTKTFILPPT
jgi:hypothetical protein